MRGSRPPGGTLDRQVDALTAVRTPVERISLGKKSGGTTERSGLRGVVVGYARDGDVIVVHTLDLLGRTGRDT